MQFIAKITITTPIEAENYDAALEVLEDMNLTIIHPVTDKEMDYDFQDWELIER
jgi:hypothetical protein